MDDIEEVLRGIDRLSPTWVGVQRWAEGRIAALSAELENPATTPDRTNVARGELKTVRALITLGTPMPQVSDGPSKSNF